VQFSEIYILSEQTLSKFRELVNFSNQIINLLILKIDTFSGDINSLLISIKVKIFYKNFEIDFLLLYQFYQIYNM
jgi:hypothetical protein